jgi:tetratricopeptide (TPR) repeat protein
LVALVLAAGAGAARATAPAAPVSPVGTPPPPVFTESDFDGHVALGRRLSQIGRYEDAVEEFRRAYELRADPRLLYEIAETYARLGASNQARFYYGRYLATAPEAPDRAEVEAKVAALAPPKPTRPRPHMVSEATLAAEAARRPPSRAWRRWWVWTAVGAVVAAGAAAIVLSRDSGTDVPPTALGDQKFFR